MPDLEVQYAGRLAFFSKQWEMITNDPLILSWLEGYKIPFLSNPIREDMPYTISHSDKELVHYNKCIQKLININAISKCDHEENEFISTVFLVPKPNGENRFILNLKCLNKFVKTIHFKLEDYRTASKLISLGCFMASIDLKDAYYLLPIHESHKKYLKFKFNNNLYNYNCLPFGLATAPYVFTKLLKPVMEFCRSKGILCVIYLDDILIFGNSFQECSKNVLTIKNIIEKLGFFINYEKSFLTPSKECKYLGFIFDSTRMIIKLPSDKRHKIYNLILKFLDMKRCYLRDYARFIGILISACPAMDYAWLYTKRFERFKFLSLLKNSSYDQIVEIPHNLREDMLWWLQHIKNDYAIIKNQVYMREIFSDASLTGWGAYCNDNRAFGYWTKEERLQHINILELKAAFFALKLYAKDINNTEILLRIDNTTAIACINKMGSVQYPHLEEISRQIWQWCEDRKIFIFASYINTKDNVEADEMSRVGFRDTEWELADYAFDKIVHSFGQPNIDLFASRNNKKCSTFVSWKQDPDAWAVDAFTFSWSRLHFYAFPPFCLILKMLRKIINDKAEGIVVIPNWPTQSWYPLYQRIKISEEIIFSPNKHLLVSLFRSHHSLHKSLELIAVKLSGKHF